MDEYFRQPVVDTFDIRILMAKSVKYTVNFLEAKEGDLHRYRQPSTPGTPSSWAQLLLEVRVTAGSLGQNPASQARWARAPTPNTHNPHLLTAAQNPNFSLQK